MCRITRQTADPGTSGRTPEKWPIAPVRNEGKTFGRGGSVSQFRYAIYARYSTDKQNPLSSTLRFASVASSPHETVGKYSSAYLFRRAISGATYDRSGLKSL